MSDGLKQINDAIDNAETFVAGRPFRTPDTSGGNGGPATWEGPGLPDDCPVQPIGATENANVFLDALDQLIIATPTQMGRNWIVKYFAGRSDYLTAIWPRIGNDGKINGFKAEQVGDAITYDCARAGIWSSTDRVRGRGAWRGPNNELILHCGDTLISKTDRTRPGVWDGLVYPAGAKLRRPLDRSQIKHKADDPDAAAWQIMTMLRGWNWRRGALDARLFFGLMIAGFLGGALKWRPSAWVTGDAGMGKSTLQKLRRDVMGSWSINASDATAAGIYQTLKFDALAVSLDEQEAGADNSKIISMVELAREAASSDLRLRGSAGHEAISFQARSSFAFSSINAIPLKGQDLGRMAQLELQPFDKSAKEPKWTLPQAEAWGREILANLLDRWHRFDDTLETYRDELRLLGHDSRGQDTFGTLLACADLPLSADGFQCEGASEEDPDLNEIWERLEADKLTEYTERSPNWKNCIEYLLRSRPADWRGTGKTSVGQVCVELMEKVQPKGDQTPTSEYKEVMASANSDLALAGVKIDQHMGDFYICIPTKHPQLTKIFHGSDWPGAHGNAGGTWSKAIRGAPEQALRLAKVRIDGVQERGTWVRLDHIIEW